MMLDFVNDPEMIRLSFEPYYTDAYLETRTDPNLVHDLASKLKEAGISTENEVDAVAAHQNDPTDVLRHGEGVAQRHRTTHRDPY